MGSELDDDDLALIDTLQAHPRISWVDASAVLGAPASNLSARWERLRRDGIAWTTLAPRTLESMTVAFVNIHCAASHTTVVAETLALDDRVMTIDVVSNGAQLCVTVITRTSASFTQLITEDLPRVPEIIDLDAFLVTALHRGGDAWRVNSLGPAQQAAVDRIAPRPPKKRRLRKSTDDALIAGLFIDGRSTAAELAKATQRSQPTVRRQLSELLDTDLATLRCDVSNRDVGWPIASTWWVKVPPIKNEQTVQSLTSASAVRSCASIVGSSNMLFSVYMRELGDLLRLERALGDSMPWLEVQQVTVHLRSRKRMGWLLDEEGRSTGEYVLPEIYTPEHS